MVSVNTRLPSKLSGLFKLHFSHSVEKMNESTFRRICGRLAEDGERKMERGWFDQASVVVPDLQSLLQSCSVHSDTFRTCENLD